MAAELFKAKTNIVWAKEKGDIYMLGAPINDLDLEAIKDSVAPKVYKLLEKSIGEAETYAKANSYDNASIFMSNKKGFLFKESEIILEAGASVEITFALNPNKAGDQVFLNLKKVIQLKEVEEPSEEVVL